MPRCLPRLPLPRCWAYPRSPQWFALVQRRFSLDGENDFYAAMLAAFAFAALMGWPSCFAVDSPAVPAVLSVGYAYMGSAGYVCFETELMDGESDFFASMLAAIAFAALMGWPSCIVADCPAVLCYAALSEVFRRFLVPAANAGLGCAFRWLWWVCLLVLFGVFVWGCDDACSFGCGEHSALHFVRDGAGCVLC